MEPELSPPHKQFVAAVYLTASAGEPVTEPHVSTASSHIKTTESKSAWSAVFKVGGGYRRCCPRDAHRRNCLPIYPTPRIAPCSVIQNR